MQKTCQDQPISVAILRRLDSGDTRSERMSHQNDLRERPQSPITLRLDDLVDHKRVGLHSDLVRRWMVALANAYAIEVESRVSGVCQLTNVRILLRLQREVPVGATVGRPRDEQVHDVFVVRFVTELARYVIGGGLSRFERHRQLGLLAGRWLINSRRASRSQEGSNLDLRFYRRCMRRRTDAQCGRERGDG